MSKNKNSIFLSILIPLYSLIFVMLVYLYFYQDTFYLKRGNIDPVSNLLVSNIKPSTTTPVTSSTIPSTTSSNSTSTIDIEKYISVKSGKYIEVLNSCTNNFEGECVLARSGPGTNFSKAAKLRTGMVLKTDSSGVGADGKVWYHVVFDEWLRHPDRLKSDWFVSGEYVRELEEKSEKIINKKEFYKSLSFTNSSSTDPNTSSGTRITKTILVNLNEQKLYAYENVDGVNKLFLETFVSTGQDDLPTPIGTFDIFYKTPSRYMQGPMDGITDQYYDLPGVPWTMYFTSTGAAIHGAYWHDNFGNQWSHGCINLYPYDAETLYKWATLGTKVTVEK